MSDSLCPCGTQHTRLSYPSFSPRFCWNSSPLSWWCRPTVSSSVASLVIFLQSFPIRQLFTSSSQSIGASASATALPVNIQDWFPLGKLAGLISLQSKEFWGVFSSFRVFLFQTRRLLSKLTLVVNCFRQFKSINSLVLRLLYGPTLISVHDYWKNHSFDYMDLCQRSYVSAF